MQKEESQLLCTPGHSANSPAEGTADTGDSNCKAASATHLLRRLRGWQMSSSTSVGRVVISATPGAGRALAAAVAALQAPVGAVCWAIAACRWHPALEFQVLFRECRRGVTGAAAEAGGNTIPELGPRT